MSVFQKLCARASFVVSRLKVVMNTTAGAAVTYGTYQTLVGGNRNIIRRAMTQGPEKPSPSVKKAAVAEEPEDLVPVYVEPAAWSRCQPSLVVHDKAHAIFLWVKVNPAANKHEVASRVAKLQELANGVDVPDDCPCGNQEINAGVGFGPDFYQAVKGDAPQPFSNDKHSLISTEPECGDILIHAKSNKLEKLKSLSMLIKEQFPKNSIAWIEETYVDAHTHHPETFPPAKKRHTDTKWGFRKIGSPNTYAPKHNHPVHKRSKKDEFPGVFNYQHAEGKLQLFPAEIPAEDRKCFLFVKESGVDDTETKRKQAALDPETGGSYVMTQKWVHDVNLLDTHGELGMNDLVHKSWNACTAPQRRKKFKPEADEEEETEDVSMEKWMDNAYQECLKMQEKYPEETIACSPGVPPPSMHRLLRQSMPYQSDDRPGLFVVSYASAPMYNEKLLDRLIAASGGEGRLLSTCGNVFMFARTHRSACWYFPAVDELQELRHAK